MKRTGLFASLFFLVLFNSCRTNSTNIQETPENLNDGIETASIAEVKFNSAIIREIIDSINTGFYPNRHSLLIYKNDKLVLENYFTGRDNLWGQDIGIIAHSDYTLHDVRSISKSIVSACVGIAIDQGKIKSVDEKVFNFFSEYDTLRNGDKEELTIKHLLTMTSGLDWNEEIPYDNPENSEIQMNNSKDGIEFVLSRKLVATPGTEWRYNGGTTALLGEIIRRVSGLNVHEFAKKYMFSTIGILNSEWTNATGTNIPAAASGLRLRSRDLLKFGILYLNEGKWQGKQVVSAEWIKQSFTSHISRPDGGGYGYQFWILQDNLDGKNLVWPAAVGNGDQRIFFDRENKMVIAMTAGNYNQFEIENNSLAILKKVYSSLNATNE